MSTQTNRIHLYVTIAPTKIKIAVALNTSETIGDLQYFIQETIKKFKVYNYKIGRIEKKANTAILLPQFKINEFLSENEELIAYPVEYALSKTANDKSIKSELEDDINNGFIAKKTKRKNNDDEALSTIQGKNKNKQFNQSNKKKEKSKEIIKDNNSNENDDKKEESEDNEDNEDNEENEDNESSDKNEEDSGDDKSEDIIVQSHKKKSK